MRARLGQHFLKSKRFAGMLIKAAHIQHNEVVLEIGPGKGVLTELLLLHTKKLYAVEKDPVLVECLQKRFAEALEKEQLVLIQDDARNESWKSHISKTPFVVVANIPYYLTSSLLRLLLTSSVPPTRMALLLQKEVAQRITHRTKHSLLSLSVRLFGTPKIITTVPPQAFHPKPQVSSAILSIENISPVEEQLQQNFFSLIHTAFRHKRKAVLKKFAHNSDIQTRLMNCGVTETTRAEDVSFDSWKQCAALL